MNIVGVLQYNSKYKYGRANNKSELFMFKPLSKKHSSYLVASSKKERVNHYAVINFLKWDKSKSKVPYGQLVKLIGPCDKIESTYEAIIYKHQLTTVKAKVRGNTERNERNNERDDERNDIRDIYVFSVDPPGCEDIDDALSIQRSDGPDVIVGIHIADVGHYFDLIEIKNYTTIYAPHQTINMIPDHFAKDICSLKPGKEHYAFSVFVKVGSAGKIIDYWFSKTVLESRKAYNYAELQTFINENRESDEKLLYEVGRSLTTADYDTHKMVEVFMIMANSLVGKYLHDNAPADTAVFRVHVNKKMPSRLTLSKEVNDMLNILQSKAAVYKLLQNKDDECFHSGLGIPYYTHFTSPIRRYVDVYTHQLLYGLISKKEFPKPPDINAINDYERNMKRVERDFNKLKLAELISGSPCEIDGIIMDFTEKAVCIYLSSHKMLHWINWVNKRDLRGLIKVITEEDEVLIDFSKGKLNLKRFETIRIKLETTTFNDEVHKKISISIPIIDRVLFDV